MRYKAESVSVDPIRIENEYGGVRIAVNAFLGNARLRIQFEV